MKRSINQRLWERKRRIERQLARRRRRQAKNTGYVRPVMNTRPVQYELTQRIRPDGLQVEARHALQFSAYNPLTGEALVSATMQAGERLTLPAGPGGLLIRGSVLPEE